MAAIPSQLTSLDFFEIKESIKSYLRTRNEFSDYDFEGSAASYLIDILAYNTYYTAFNANMALNEAFLETATVRDNIVKIAKQLNYTPASIKAAKACLDVTVQTLIGLNGTTYPSSVTMKKGDVFVASNASDSFTFVLLRDLEKNVDPGTGIAKFENLLIYQGNLLNYNYTVDYTKKQDYIIPSEDVDVGLLTVTISPSEGAEEKDAYNQASNVTGLNSTSRIYYLEESDDLRYRLIFGDGVIGRKLIDGEYINIEYVRTDGTEANGADDFQFIGRIVDSDGRFIAPDNIGITTKEKAGQGEEAETPISIKYNAPRSFATQNRAVTESDYENIVQEIYPQAASVTAFGGEKLKPPVYGKVFIAVRPKTGNTLNDSTKKTIENQLRKYTIASILPEIIDPINYYVIPRSYVYFDGNKTQKTPAEISSNVLKAMDQWNKANAPNRFDNRVELSKFGSMIDNADDAINGSVTQFTMGQNIDQFAFDNVFTQPLNFGNPIANPGKYTGGDSEGNKCLPGFSTVKTGTFYATGYTDDVVNLINTGDDDGDVTNGLVSTIAIDNGDLALVPVSIRDDGLGNLMLTTIKDEQEIILDPNVGNVDYGAGEVNVGPLSIASTPDGTTRVPVEVVPEGGTIGIPEGVDPTLFNPTVNAFDFREVDVSIPPFDPFNFKGFNFGDTTGINIIDYPIDAFEYPVDDSCF